MSKTCKNCRWWGIGPSADIQRDGFVVKSCYYGNGENAFRMNSNEMSLECTHDGPIYTGPDFGCIHFEST